MAITAKFRYSSYWGLTVLMVLLTVWANVTMCRSAKNLIVTMQQMYEQKRTELEETRKISFECAFI